jgi:osmoprotectant transport system substrate-binding protein
MHMRKPRPLALMSAVGVVAAAFVLAACASSSSGGGATASGVGVSAQPTGPVTVAAFNFNESKILANMYADVLAKAGFDVTVKALGAREIVEPALEKGSAGGGVDVVPEYLATFTEFLNTKENGKDAPAKATPDVNATLAAAQGLASQVGITVLTPSAAADENAFAVTQEFATKNNLSTLSDLAKYTGPLVLGGPPECPQRPFCQPGLQTTYGIHFTSFTSLDAGGPLTKKALQQGKIQLGLVFSSDGGIEALGLKVLADDKHLQNPDVIVAAVNTKSVSDKLTAALNAVAAALTTDDLVALNKKADIDGDDPAQVAKDWLTSKGLL